MLTLRKRTAVITGAANGVGRALAMCAASRGMSLALADIDESALNAVRKSLPSEAQVLVEVLDVRDRSAQDAFASSVFERFGSVALVFANAGVMRAGTTWQLDPADWDAVFDINVKGVVHTASAFMPRLLEQSEPSRIVITGSTSSFLPRPHLTAYSASKHALWGVAEAMHQELAQQNAPVSISLLAPSGVKTGIAAVPLAAGASSKQREIHELLEQFGMPADVLAEQTFEALQHERFWVLPHPDFKDALTLRAQSVVEERDPRD